MHFTLSAFFFFASQISAVSVLEQAVLDVSNQSGEAKHSSANVSSIEAAVVSADGRIAMAISETSQALTSLVTAKKDNVMGIEKMICTVTNLGRRELLLRDDNNDIVQKKLFKGTSVKVYDARKTDYPQYKIGTTDGSIEGWTYTRNLHCSIFPVYEPGILKLSNLAEFILVDPAGSAFSRRRKCRRGEARPSCRYEAGGLSELIYKQMTIRGVKMWGQMHEFGQLRAGQAVWNPSVDGVVGVIHAVGPNYQGRNVDQAYYDTLEETFKSIKATLDRSGGSSGWDVGTKVALPLISSSIFKPANLDINVYMGFYIEMIDKYLGHYIVYLNLYSDAEKSAFRSVLTAAKGDVMGRTGARVRTGARGRRATGARGRRSRRARTPTPPAFKPPMPPAKCTVTRKGGIQLRDDNNDLAKENYLPSGTSVNVYGVRKADDGYEQYKIGTTDDSIVGWTYTRNLHCAGPDSFGGTNVLVDFYKNDGQDDKKRRLRDMWAWPDSELERQHDYIQWMFPTATPSEYNPNAPILTAELSVTFQTDETVRRNIRKSFDVYLAFLGFRYDHGKVLRGDQFYRKGAKVLVPGNHNLKRCSRILECLRLTGHDERMRAFYGALQELNDEGVIGDQTMGYWRKSVSR